MYILSGGCSSSSSSSSSGGAGGGSGSDGVDGGVGCGDGGGIISRSISGRPTRDNDSDDDHADDDDDNDDAFTVARNTKFGMDQIQNVPICTRGHKSRKKLLAI